MGRNASIDKKKLEVILVVVVLACSIVLSYSIRAQPLQYAMELDEFDPYYNYRATEYLLTHGWESYLEWWDTQSWYPIGRDVSATSQVMLHLTAAMTYKVFGFGMPLYDYLIYFPAVIGSLTALPVFFLIRFLTNSRVGMMGAFFFAVSIPFIQRGTAGWFKSEPLGLFYAITAFYLVLSGVRDLQQGRRNSGLLRLVFGGMIMSFAISAWGGAIFFIIPIVVWVFTLPGVYHNFRAGLTIIGIGLFTGIMYLNSLNFDRANSLISGAVSLALVGAMIYLAFHRIMEMKFNLKYRYTILIFLGILVFLTWIGLWMNVIPMPNERYINVLIPTTSGNTLVASVSEHQTPDFGHVFERTVFLMLFAPLGVLAIIKRTIPKDVGVICLVLSGLGLYIGTTIVRLELFMSLSMIILASLGIYWIFMKFNDINKQRPKGIERALGTVIIVMLLVVTVAPSVVNWSIMVDRPPLIKTGAAMLGQTDAWTESLDWIKYNTPEDSTILAWWDYGYWIETKGNRTTFMDNAAFHSERISEYAGILTGPPDEGVEKLRELEVDYVLLYFLGIQHPTSDSYTMLGFGGDLSKMGWILRIGDRNPDDYIDSSGLLNQKFYSETLYGSLVPFTPVADEIESVQQIDGMTYPWQRMINPDTGQLYQYGWYAYNPTKNVNGMKMVYASSEFVEVPEDRTFNAIVIYEVLK